MNLLNLIILQCQPQQGQQDGMSSLLSFLPFILIILVFWLFIIRPQQKRQKERQKLLSGVKKGDKIITAGGIHGTIEGVEERTVLVKISENVKVKLEKNSIATIIGVTDELEKKK